MFEFGFETSHCLTRSHSVRKRVPELGPCDKKCFVPISFQFCTRNNEYILSSGTQLVLGSIIRKQFSKVVRCLAVQALKHNKEDFELYPT